MPLRHQALADSGPKQQAPPDVRPLAPQPWSARRPPARPGLPAADPPGPRGTLPLSPLPSPGLPPCPPQLPRGKTHSPGRRQSPGPSAAPTSEAVAMGSAAATAAAAARGTERAAGPKAGRRGPRRRGPAPTLRAPPGELRPTGPPRTRLGPGWGRGPCPERHAYVFALLGARCGRECPRACAGLRECPRAPRTGGGGADVRTVCACAGTRVPAASASQSLLLEIPPG